MGLLLIHITHGPEAPTRAALGLLVAGAAIDEGHEVNVFMAGVPRNRRAHRLDLVWRRPFRTDDGDV